MLTLSWPHWLVIVSALISIAGSSAYIRDTLSGRTTPNRGTWFMWALAPLVGTAAAIGSNADIWACVRIFLAGFLPLLVVCASFFSPKGYWKLTPFDLLCGLLSILALIIWTTVDSPRTAILLAATGDGFAAIPTIIKAWKYPETETAAAYITSFISVMLVVPSIPVWNIENSAFQLYLMVVDTLLLIAIYRKQLRFWN